MFANIRMIYKSLFKSKIMIFYSFFLPLFLLILSISAFTFSVDYNALKDGSSTLTLLSPIYILPLSSTIGVYTISFFVIPIIIKEWSECQTFSLIEVSTQTKKYFLITFLCVQILTIISLFFINFFIASGLICLIDPQNIDFVKYMIDNMNYGELFYALFVFSFSTILLGMLIGFWTTSNVTIQSIGTLVVVLSFLFGGTGIPLQLLFLGNQIDGSNINLAALSFIFPFKYNIMQISEAMTQGFAFNGAGLDSGSSNMADYGHSSIFDINQPYLTNLVAIPKQFNGYDIWGADNPIIMKTWWNLFNSIDKGIFEFASKQMKLADLIVPWLYSIIAAGSIMFLLKRRNK